MRSFYLLFFIIFLLSCDNVADDSYKKGNAWQGVPVDTFDLLNDGPHGFTLDYFPKEAIRLSDIGGCEVVEQNDSLKRVAKNVKFDHKGNVMEEQNDYFSLWFMGTVQGQYDYKYDTFGRLIEKKGIDHQGNNDTVMTKWTYNTDGLLQSRDDYEYSRKLKPGADRHLPSSQDYEPQKTWHQTFDCKYLWENDSLIVLSFIEGKQINRESKYLMFDNHTHLKSVKKYWGHKLAETTTYEFKNNTISGRSEIGRDDGTSWVYRSLAVLDGKGRLVIKIVFNDDSSERAKMIVAYNKDGTLDEIKYGKTIQKFIYRRF